MKKFLALLLALVMVLTLAACGGSEMPAPDSAPDGAVTYKVGICNYVDDASLNQIVENIRDRLAKLGQANNVNFEIFYDKRVQSRIYSSYAEHSKKHARKK